MAKGISYKIIIGNSLISTNRDYLTKEQVYLYCHIVDNLLPEGYYTKGDNNSFSDFCEEYPFLVRRTEDALMTNCDSSLLERYCRIGLPTEVVKVLDIAGEMLNEIELQVSNDAKNNNGQNLSVLCDKASVVVPKKIKKI